MHRGLGTGCYQALVSLGSVDDDVKSEVKAMREKSATSARLVALVVGWLAVTTQAYASPISPYYVTAGNQGLNWILRGSSAVSFNQRHWFVDQGHVFGEHAIAVDGTVRTLGTNFVADGLPPSQGAEYTLAGVYTGVDFDYPIDAAALSFLDATTDGDHIYAVASNDAAVYQMEMDWTDPIRLFAVRPNDVGITFDQGTLWVSNLGENVEAGIVRYSLTGTALFSFHVPGAEALALDPADRTLWFTHGFDGTFYQYSRDGQFLSSVKYPELAGTNHLGGEFAVTEPSAFVLGCLAVLGVAVSRARRPQLR